MSQFPSDPADIRQFHRRWTADSTPIKFLSELTKAELDRLAILHGERVVRRLPLDLIADLTSGERRDLARAFGRPSLRKNGRKPSALTTAQKLRS